MRREQREALSGVENIGLDVIDDLGALPEFAHRAGEADPVQHLMLARVFHFPLRQLAPIAEAVGTKLIIAGPIRDEVGIEPAMLLRQRTVRPARRADQGDTPGRGREVTRRGAPDLEAACWARRWRRDLVGTFADDAGAGLDELAAVAVHVKGNDRIAEAEAALLVIEIDHRVVE